jgi:PAS domain S-box-containing protein
MVRPDRVFSGHSDLHSVLESSPECVVAVHVDGHIGYANPPALMAFGYTSAEMVGLPVEALVRDDLAAVHVQHRTRYNEHRRPRPMGGGLEIAARRKDGSEFPVEIGLIPLVGEEGHWLLATVVDISARRAAVAELEGMTRAYRMQAHSSQAIVRAGTVGDLFAETLRAVVEEGGYLAGWVGQPRRSGEIEMVAAAGGLDDYLGQLRVTTDPGQPQGRGPVSVALREGRPVYADEVAPPQILASASLPLRVHGEPVAVLSVYSQQADAFGDSTRALLEGMADNASFGLSALVAAADLDRISVQRRELLRRLVRAQEDERSKIAADVHDDSVQSLAVVDLRLGLLRRQVEAQAPELVEAVALLQETVGSVSAGLRLLLFELEPADAVATLPEMLTEAAAVIFEGDHVSWAVTVDAPAELDHVARDPSWLPEPARTMVVRVVKEALRNVRKHSGAGSVTVTIRPDSDGVEVVVQDDGIGIDPEHVRSTPGHRGLRTMRERVEIGGGWTQLDGGAAGTSLRFWMPRTADGDGRSD